ncbi:MAG: hypothetical protein ACRDBL_04595 [Rhabdaerophilum sp.]
MPGGALKQAAETFRFQVSHVIPESQLYAWFEQAEPGERVVYCQGYLPLRDDAAWKLAGAWASEGLVHLVTEREGTATRWIAERRPLGLVSGAGAARGAKRTAAEDLVQVQLRALLALLRDAAAAGRRCPTKTEQAEAVTGQTSLRARNRVTYLRKRLVAEGKISVVAGAQNRAPVVTILARGKGCGLSTLATAVEGEV